MNEHKYSLTAFSAGALICLSGISGCATTRMPTDHFALAQASIERAEQAGATELAPVELQAARDKLAAAKASPHNSAGAIAAARLADEAQVDGRLAEASAQAARSRRAANELDRSLDALRAETNRSTP
ncbi:MAG: DUF4398 domain-containing protein [Steroidobacteraceae bacterium]|jgi:hypothetical protein